MNVSFFGYLSKAPETSQLQNGSSIVRFSVAVKVTSKDKETNKAKTVFVEVSAFGKQGEMIMNSFTKGSRIYVSGELHDISYNQGNDGRIFINTSVSMQSFEFVDKREEATALGAGQQQQVQSMQMPGMGTVQQPGLSSVVQPGMMSTTVQPMTQPNVMSSIPQPNMAPNFNGTMNMAPATSTPASVPQMSQQIPSAPTNVPQIPVPQSAPMPAGLSNAMFSGLQ